MISMACGVETFTYSHDGTISLSRLLAQRFAQLLTETENASRLLYRPMMILVYMNVKGSPARQIFNLL